MRPDTSAGCRAITTRQTVSFRPMNTNPRRECHEVIWVIMQKGTERTANMTALCEATRADSGVGLTTRPRFSICLMYSRRE